MPGAQRFIIFDDDYILLSLSKFTQPVKVVTKTLLDIRIVEGLVGELVDNEPMDATMASDEQMTGAVEEQPAVIADAVDSEPMDGVLVTSEDIVGILED